MISFDIERDLYNKKAIMIGVDEAGRGSWAGPLVATACWIDFRRHKYLHSEVNDSKKLNHLKRKEIILSLDNYVYYSSAIATVYEIDKYGLSYANAIAMKRSIFSVTEVLSKNKENSNKNFCIYIDGKFKPDFANLDKFLKHKCLKLKNSSVITLIKGDSISKTIALAGIISKEKRDAIMKQLAINNSSYSFNSHFGYGTVKHRNAILKNGVSSSHRKSFKPIATIYSKDSK